MSDSTKPAEPSVPEPKPVLMPTIDITHLYVGKGIVITAAPEPISKDQPPVLRAPAATRKA
jgi:hypothetical protein